MSTRDQARKEKHIDFVSGKVVTILHYEIGEPGQERGVKEWPDGSMLIQVSPSRWRSFPAEHKLCRAIIAGQTVAQLERDRLRRRKEGTHEAVTYYKDNDGRIGVPPDPSLPPPDNVTVHTADTLAEIDQLSATMKRQMYEEFQDDGVATEFWDQRLGFDRSELVRAINESPTAKGREIARQLLADIDKEGADRQRISTEAIFHWREYDGR